MSLPIAKWNAERLETTGPGTRCLLGALKPVLVVAFAAPLGACAISMPIASLVAPASRDAKTSTMERPTLARMLDGEDLRRAEAALATALDPQANGALVAWENPQSGAKGSFTPRGAAYPEDAKICRGFYAEIDRKGDTRILKGTACADKASEWTVAEIDRLKPSGALD